jgi:hypothetical protein
LDILEREEGRQIPFFNHLINYNDKQIYKSYGNTTRILYYTFHNL